MKTQASPTIVAAGLLFATFGCQSSQTTEPAPTGSLSSSATTGASGGQGGAATGQGGAGAGGQTQAGGSGGQARIVLLGGDPLSGTEAPYEKKSHSLSPTGLWQSASAPLPTNSWWQNLVLAGGDLQVNSLPYLIKTLGQGIEVSQPNQVVLPNYTFSAFAKDIALGATEDLGPRTVTAHDPLSVTMTWSTGGSSMTAPLVRGMAYVSATYDKLTPVITTQHAVTKVNGQGPGGVVKASRFVLEMNNGHTWHVYASPEIEMQSTGGGLTATAAYAGTLRVARRPSAQDESVLDAHAACVPTGGALEATSQGNSAALIFDWQTSGDCAPLMMTLPHHRDVLSGVTQTSLALDTIKGEMQGVSGKRWLLTEALTSISWYAPSPIDPQKKDAVSDALEADVSKNVVAADPYFGGKQIAAIARLALIAEQLGKTDLVQTYRSKVAAALEPWLDGSNNDPLVYDQTWGGVVSKAGISNPGAHFGQGYYNDHHFHYGHFIYAAAVMAKLDPSWASTWSDAVMHLIRDIAEPSGADPLYTFTRPKDWFTGHSWANGLFVAGDSRNQESTSEAVNAWYSVYLFGLATDNARLADLGRLMLQMELRSTWRYWQITSKSDVYSPPFSQNKVVGILWSTKADYGTWFGNKVEFIHGIQMLPFTPMTESLLRPEWITESYPVVSQALNDPALAEGWRGFIVMAHGVIDKQAAWQDAMKLTGYDDGNSKTNTLYWLATRP